MPLDWWSSTEDETSHKERLRRIQESLAGLVSVTRSPEIISPKTKDELITEVLFGDFGQELHAFLQGAILTRPAETFLEYCTGEHGWIFDSVGRPTESDISQHESASFIAEIDASIREFNGCLLRGEHDHARRIAHFIVSRLR